MNIKELFEETSDDYINRLTKTLKIKKLGSGVYAHVFQHPEYHNVAVKYVEDDPEYLSYVRYIRRMQNNLWVPKIVGVSKVKLEDRRNDKISAYLIFFQKLRPARRIEIKTAVQKFLEDVPDEEIYRYLYDLRRNITSFEEVNSDMFKKISYLSKDKDIRQISKLLSQLSYLDIHNGNVMMRDEGDRTQLVFTDPVVS